MLRVAVAKYHKGGWCERNVLSHSSRGWKPKIKVLTGFPLRVLRGDLFHPFSWLPVFSYQSLVFLSLYKGFPGSSNGKESALNAGDPGSIPWSGRSPLEGNGYPLQSSCLENSMDRGAWRGYSPWGRKQSKVTEQVNNSSSYSVAIAVAIERSFGSLLTLGSQQQRF